MSVIVFALVHLVPGDPVRLALGTRFSQETYDALQERSGLDQPLVQQFVTWFGRAITGNLGVSFRSGDTVAGLIGERLPATLTLAFASILVALVIAVPLGTISALRPRSVVDRVATVISQFGISVPEFWMGIVLILVFAGTLGWLPSGGYVPLT
ncbi:MAG TPA: ABC transporter permease, partial [Blastococcus sp.]